MATILSRPQCIYTIQPFPQCGIIQQLRKRSMKRYCWHDAIQYLSILSIACSGFTPTQAIFYLSWDIRYV